DGQGRKRWFRDYVSAVEQPSGVVKLRAVLVEVTSQKAAERRQEMHLQVTSILARSTDLQIALREILPILGQSLEWDVVVYRRLRPEGKALFPFHYWSAEGPWARSGGLGGILEELSDPGDEVGEALTTKNPVWRKVPERLPAEDPTRLPGGNGFSRIIHASHAGLTAGLACPVMAGEEVYGVLEFFSSLSKPQDEAHMGA